MNRLKEIYKTRVVKELLKELNLDNSMDAPKIDKITLNAGIGPFRESREAVESFVEELAMISGQKPVANKARLSESGFKIKKGDLVGYSVTLRGERMWAFLDKLISVVLPRVRDFRGLSLNSFDENGNYSLGIREHTIFPEVNANQTKGNRSLQVNIRISSHGKEHSRALLEKLGMPFKKD